MTSLNKHLFLSSIFMASTTWAANVTVLKATGQKAVVKFSDDHVPKSGEKLPLSTGEATLSDSDSNTSGGGSSGSRHNVIGLALDASLASGNFTFKLDGSFGWNMGQFELGPIVSFEKSTATTFGGGAFFDFNFIENKGSEQFIPGLGVQGLFKSVGSAVVGADSATLIIARPSVFLKMFVFKNTLALRGDGYFSFTKATAANTTAFGLMGSIEAYF